jgi:hypothetical protein
MPLESPAIPDVQCTRVNVKPGGKRPRKFRTPKGRKEHPASVSTAVLTVSSVLTANVALAARALSNV